jgi:pyrroline-5-carboxylate reductase
MLADVDWVLLAVRPEQLGDALPRLTLRSDQVLISAVAGLAIAELRLATGEDTAVVRIMPSSYIDAIDDGLIPIFPPSQEVQAVLKLAGKVVTFDTEDQFELAMFGACLAGWMYRFMAEHEAWFIGNGLSHTQARQIVAGNIAGASSYAVARSDVDLTRISDGIATHGTYTKAGLDYLIDTRAITPWLQALDIVKNRLIDTRTEFS